MYTSTCILIFVLLGFIGFGIVTTTATCSPSPVVQTKYGALEGTYDGYSREGRRFYQFRGIQYAVVAERFRPSVKPNSWEGTKSAKQFGPACTFPESPALNTTSSEDCLYLNVYTPSLSVQRNGSYLPVAVFIHGGSFKYNTGQFYGPNYLMDEDIVFVTINYRLGVLGFLSTEDEASPGNYGLKDQVMALRYIQENIHAFGGDKNKVSIMGQSAGGASVTFHLVSPMSKGLFRNAIAQSGTFLCQGIYTMKPLRYTKQLAKYFGCKNLEDTKAIVECLKAIPANKLADVSQSDNATLKFFEDPLAIFGPSLEPLIGNGENTFLAENPLKLLKSGKVEKVPLLSGIVKEEGIYLWAAYLLLHQANYAVRAREDLQANFTKWAPYAFYFDEKAPADQLKGIAQEVEKFYFGKVGGFSLNDSQTLYQLAHLYSDRLFVDSGIKFMELYAQHAPTYPYLYTYNKYVGLEFGFEDWHNKYKFDATHAAELDMIISPQAGKVRNDKPDFDEVSKSVAKLWASFIKNGVPTATYGSERKFPPIDPKKGLERWYRLDTDTELLDNSLFSTRQAFWANLSTLGFKDYDLDHCYC